MKKWTKSVLVTVLSAVFLLDCMGTAWAATSDRDTNSNFAKSAGTQEDGINQFYLIKDYDSVHETKNDTHSTKGAPYSSSPAETFTYTITPYKVWNAGSTFSGGTATPITTNNMLMLEAPSSPESGTTYSSVTGTGADRSFVIKQTVGANAALKNSDTANEFDTNKTLIVLPNYTTVGDYWYKVVESRGENNNNPTTGVFYGTNESHTGDNSLSNGGHDGTYYIHVQVTEKGTTATGSPSLVKNVTLHTGAPDKNYTNEQYNASRNTTYAANKVNAIQNKYYAGQLKVKKVVLGNSGDKNQFFKVRVTFTKPEGSVVNSDIEIKDAYTLTGSTYGNSATLTIPGQNNTSFTDTDYIKKWDKGVNSTDEAKAVAVFYVKDGTTVSFFNIPLGINYTVEEYTTGDLGYENTFTMIRGNDELTPSFNGNTLVKDDVVTGSHFYDDVDGNTIPPTDVGAKGSITGANADEITITNSKGMTIDIGVITEDAPYIALLTVAGAALILVIARKKKAFEV